MKSIDYVYKNTDLVPSSELDSYACLLKPEIITIQKALPKNYETDYASLYLSSDEQMHAYVKAVIAEKKALHPSMLIIIGIGGSNLGTMAVLHALQGMSNEQAPLKVYWADTVEASNMHTIIQLMEAQLRIGSKILLTVISKSGITTETIANFLVLLGVLKTHHAQAYQQNITVITDKNSSLWNVAQQEHISCLEIPRLVGGRFSVLSPVGLFPLGLLGIDIDQLCAGARSVIPLCTDVSMQDNPAALSAAFLAHHYKKGIKIHDTFLFSSELESLGKWYRQLMGESIGKKRSKKGELVHTGIVPTVSIGSTDLHSVGQLYNAAPQLCMTTFVSIKTCMQDYTIPAIPPFDQLIPAIENNSIQGLMNGIFKATQKVYTAQKKPFVSFIIPEKTPYYIGQFLQIKMLEIMYLGFLLDINPFDQPEVELYKQAIREILHNE